MDNTELTLDHLIMAKAIFSKQMYNNQRKFVWMCQESQKQDFIDFFTKLGVIGSVDVIAHEPLKTDVDASR